MPGGESVAGAFQARPRGWPRENRQPEGARVPVIGALRCRSGRYARAAGKVLRPATPPRRSRAGSPPQRASSRKCMKLNARPRPAGCLQTEARPASRQFRPRAERNGGDRREQAEPAGPRRPPQRRGYGLPEIDAEHRRSAATRILCRSARRSKASRNTLPAMTGPETRLVSRFSILGPHLRAKPCAPRRPVRCRHRETGVSGSTLIRRRLAPVSGGRPW